MASAWPYRPCMQPVVTTAEMRALDRATIDEIGLPGAVLMETAGRAIADAASPRASRGQVAVVCGPGNNGGDGYVAARVLRERGADAVVYLTVPRDGVGGDARLHLDALERAGGVVLDLSGAAQLEEHGAALAGAAVIVDAVFGTGVRPVEGHAAEVIAKINGSRAWVVAADLPSGIDADTGLARGACVDADATVTMGALKVGLVGAPGFVHAGAVTVAEIGIPRALVMAQGVRAGLVEEGDVRADAPRGAPLDHKGRRGHVVVVGGSPGRRGAARLATLAALRGGAGLVTLAGPGPGELTAPDPAMTAICESAADLAPIAAGKAAIVIGPGMIRGDAGAAMVGAALAVGCPVVVDADGLNVCQPGQFAGAAGPVVLTPHPGEAARLLGVTVDAIEADRMGAVRRLAAETRAVVVLKGARTVICDGTLGDDFVWINPTGGPALATGGTGDVLAGLLGALLAQGVPAAAAARVAVWAHGAAGDAARPGAHAGDIADAAAAALGALVPA
jgi:ADP-dependent NAD(P)H-hydrate dehydratase / NAD(P)H-hydrate epimerase